MILIFRHREYYNFRQICFQNHFNRTVGIDAHHSAWEECGVYFYFHTDKHAFDKEKDKEIEIKASYLSHKGGRLKSGLKQAEPMLDPAAYQTVPKVVPAKSEIITL